MKKTLIVALFVLAVVERAAGQTLHAIIFANTEDATIGASVESDFQYMNVEMTTIAKSIGYGLKKYYYYGPGQSFSPAGVKQALAQLSCGSNDIVFFYYSGHGARAMDEKSRYPEMILTHGAWTGPEQLFSLEEVYRRVMAKSPRLAIVMGDLCNKADENYYHNPGAASKGATIISKGVEKTYKDLFLNVKGGLIVTSSKAGQTSYSYPAGGAFTICFREILQAYVDLGAEISWERLLDDVIVMTKEMTEEGKRREGEAPQEPIYDASLAAATPPVSHAPSPAPTQPAQSNDAPTNLRDDLAYALTIVGNRDVPKIDRIKNIKAALQRFSGGAKVQVVGCDNSTIVNTASAKGYLNYLSIAANMAQVVVLETKNDASGKLSYAKVHEIHYE